MAMNYLLDTNILIDIHAGRIAFGPSVGHYTYSVISEIELLSWPAIKPVQEQELRYLLGHLQRVEVDAVVRETAIRLRRQYRLKLPDAIIAASAVVNNAVLLTNDQQLLALPVVRSQAVELTHD
ncbi:putative nucleic acid-binding protein, contains PIN domain [Gammaproteobacteria bacterium]